jgi:hypothetical protein
MLIGEDGRAFMLRVDRYPDVGGMADLALYSRPRWVRNTRLAEVCAGQR